ncbi:hypothetical protein ACFPRL_31775 [Pseudoclavibacter helvolus]
MRELVVVQGLLERGTRGREPPRDNRDGIRRKLLALQELRQPSATDRRRGLPSLERSLTLRLLGFLRCLPLRLLFGGHFRGAPTLAEPRREWHGKVELRVRGGVVTTLHVHSALWNLREVRLGDRLPIRCEDRPDLDELVVAPPWVLLQHVPAAGKVVGAQRLHRLLAGTLITELLRDVVETSGVRLRSLHKTRERRRVRLKLHQRVGLLER